MPILAPRVLPDGITWFDTPVPEFRLHVIELTGPELASPRRSPRPPPALAPGRPPRRPPRILLCLGGSCTLRAATGQELALTRGGSCFIPFADGPVHATGHARLVQATPGDPTPVTPRQTPRHPRHSSPRHPPPRLTPPATQHVPPREPSGKGRFHDRRAVSAAPPTN